MAPTRGDPPQSLLGTHGLRQRSPAARSSGWPSAGSRPTPGPRRLTPDLARADSSPQQSRCNCRTQISVQPRSQHRRRPWHRERGGHGADGQHAHWPVPSVHCRSPYPSSTGSREPRRADSDLATHCWRPQGHPTSAGEDLTAHCPSSSLISAPQVPTSLLTQAEPLLVRLRPPAPAELQAGALQAHLKPETSSDVTSIHS